MARYLRQCQCRITSGFCRYAILYILPFTSESYNDKDGCVDNSLGNDNLSITGIFSKRPGVLVPHKVQL